MLIFQFFFVFSVVVYVSVFWVQDFWICNFLAVALRLWKVLQCSAGSRLTSFCGLESDFPSRKSNFCHTQKAHNIIFQRVTKFTFASPTKINRNPYIYKRCLKDGPRAFRSLFRSLLRRHFSSLRHCFRLPRNFGFRQKINTCLTACANFLLIFCFFSQDFVLIFC